MRSSVIQLNTLWIKLHSSLSEIPTYFGLQPINTKVKKKTFTFLPYHHLSQFQIDLNKIQLKLKKHLNKYFFQNKQKTKILTSKVLILKRQKIWVLKNYFKQLLQPNNFFLIFFRKKYIWPINFFNQTHSKWISSHWDKFQIKVSIIRIFIHSRSPKYGFILKHFSAIIQIT